jgi:hypothetical protein
VADGSCNQLSGCFGFFKQLSGFSKSTTADTADGSTDQRKAMDSDWSAAYHCPRRHTYQYQTASSERRGSSVIDFLIRYVRAALDAVASMGFFPPDGESKAERAETTTRYVPDLFASFRLRSNRWK